MNMLVPMKNCPWVQGNLNNISRRCISRGCITLSSLATQF